MSEHAHLHATDWSAAAMVERLGGDEALARELVALFTAEYPRMIGAVRDAIASGSGESVRRAAHALKGSVANFVDGAAVAAAFALERIGRENRLQEAPAALQSLDREMEALLRHFRAFQSGSACAS